MKIDTDKLVSIQITLKRHRAYLEVFAHLCELAISMDVPDTWPLNELDLQAHP